MPKVTLAKEVWGLCDPKELNWQLREKITEQALKAQLFPELCCHIPAAGSCPERPNERNQAQSPWSQAHGSHPGAGEPPHAHPSDTWALGTLSKCPSVSASLDPALPSKHSCIQPITITLQEKISPPPKQCLPNFAFPKPRGVFPPSPHSQKMPFLACSASVSVPHSSSQMSKHITPTDALSTCLS